MSLGIEGNLSKIGAIQTQGLIEAAFLSSFRSHQHSFKIQR